MAETKQVTIKESLQEVLDSIVFESDERVIITAIVNGVEFAKTVDVSEPQAKAIRRYKEIVIEQLEPYVEELIRASIALERERIRKNIVECGNALKNPAVRSMLGIEKE